MADVSRLAEIHLSGWRHAYRGLVSDHELFVERQVVKSIKMFTQIIADTPERVCLFDDGILKGFALHLSCREEDALAAWEIGAIYVQPEFIGTGVGTAIVGRVEAIARAAGALAMKLWVLEQNAKARRFYEKCGYRPDGRSKMIEDWQQTELRYHKDL
jgi:GNAT superfamily N-acetyltransferase